MRPFLRGRVALVTGASRGLGAGAARVLGRAGAAVIATARDETALNGVVADIAADGAHALAIPADLARDGDVENLVKHAMDAAGRIDFLINIGGSAEGIGNRLWETPADLWDRLAGANITGVLNLLRHVVPVMQRQHSGRLLFLSSSATFRPWPETGAYGATKAAVNQMVQTLALELDGSGITANVFNPGPIDTQVFNSVSEVLQRTGPRRGRDATPVPGRPPELVAQLLLWLCAPETQDLTGDFVQWNNPNTREAMDKFLQTHGIGAVA